MPRSERLLRSIQDPSTNARDDKDHFCLQRSFGARGLKTGLPKIAAKRDFWERGAAGATGKAASIARRLPWRLDATSLLRMTGGGRFAPQDDRKRTSFLRMTGGGCKLSSIYPKFYILHSKFYI